MSRSEEERERARLERERKRMSKRGEKPPPLPPIEVAPPMAEAPIQDPDEPEPLAAEEPPFAAHQETQAFDAIDIEELGLDDSSQQAESVPPPWSGDTQSFDPAAALVTDYTDHLAQHYEEPPLPPEKVSHAHFARRVGVIALVLLVVVGGWVLLSVFQPFAGDGKGTGKISVRIAQGAGVSKIAAQLEKAKVIPSAKKFGWRAKWSGNSDKFKAGRFVFGAGMSYSAVIDLLVQGPNAGTVTVSIPEGRSRYEIAAQAKSLGLEGDYMADSKSSSLLNPKRYGAPSGSTLEGFLFPATYELPASSSVTRLVSQQLQAFKVNIRDVSMRYARTKNLTVFDVLTIASLIDREVSKASERKIVASVIYNRLKQGIPLGIDATSRFETRNWTKPLTNATLQKDTPYNTRINKGLPPGPIGNPGLAAIQAAARPATTGFLFYVANPCKPGTHTFTKTNAASKRRRRVTTPPARRPVTSSQVAADSTTPRFGVAGYPVGHSRSPQLHAAAYAALGLSADYQRLPIPPELFAETVTALPGSGFAGINVTIPHKHAALALADHATPAATAIGAANTLTFKDGQIHAANTDAPGLIAALDRPLQGLKALVLGAGGTARAAAWALQDAGVEVAIWNRTTERAEQLAESLGLEVAIDTAPEQFDLIVNTTAAGMKAGETEDSVLAAFALDLGRAKDYATIVDFVYRDGGSPLTTAAHSRGIDVIDGDELLVRQGALSFEIWFEQGAPLDAMRAALTN